MLEGQSETVCGTDVRQEAQPLGYIIELRRQGDQLLYVELDPQDLTREACPTLFDVESGVKATMSGPQQCTQDIRGNTVDFTYTEDTLELIGVDRLHEVGQSTDGLNPDCDYGFDMTFERR